MSDFHAPLHKSTSYMRMREGFGRMSSLNRKESVRSIFTRGRLLEAGIEWGQLPVKTSRNIVDIDGVFFFIVGLSIVGGGDKVRP